MIEFPYFLLVCLHPKVGGLAAGVGGRVHDHGNLICGLSVFFQDAYYREGMLPDLRPSIEPCSLGLVYVECCAGKFWSTIMEIDPWGVGFLLGCILQPRNNSGLAGFNRTI
jgi:hypothetical protein